MVDDGYEFGLQVLCVLAVEAVLDAIVPALEQHIQLLPQHHQRAVTVQLLLARLYGEDIQVIGSVVVVVFAVHI